MEGEFEVITINENNKKRFEIVCFRDYYVEDIKINNNTYKNVYIKIDDNQLLRISGNIKKIISNLDKNELKKENVLYRVVNLEKGTFNGNDYYYYKLLTKDVDRNTYIVNYCDSFNHYVNLFNKIPSICTIKIINENNIELTNNNDNYIYSFLSMEEVKRFNKTIYNYIISHPKINKFNLINIRQDIFNDNHYYTFDIQEKVFKF